MNGNAKIITLLKLYKLAIKSYKFSKMMATLNRHIALK